LLKKKGVKQTGAQQGLGVPAPSNGVCVKF